MYDVEHPDITHVNKTGYTKQQLKDIEAYERETREAEGDE